MSYDLSKLECRKPGPNGSTVARCPACAKNGTDKTGQHLSVRPNGEFNCIVGSTILGHNSIIRAFLKGYSTDGDFEYIDPEPKLTIEKIYPESTLNDLVKDHTYWLGRGAAQEVLEKLECGVAPKTEKGKLAGRTVFPVRNLDGKIVGFTGRLIVENSFAPRWKHLMKASKVVYPWNVTGDEIAKAKKVVLVESVGDLIAVLSCGIKPVLCIFGLNLNDLIVGTLIGADVKKVIVSLNRDADPRKGQAAANRITRKLEAFIPEVEVRLPKTCKDWGDAVKTQEGLADLATFREEIGS